MVMVSRKLRNFIGGNFLLQISLLMLCAFGLSFLIDLY